MKILVSEKAKADLLLIFSYLAQRNSTAAENLAQAIDGRFEHLARFPFIGRERNALLRGFEASL